MGRPAQRPLGLPAAAAYAGFRDREGSAGPFGHRSAHAADRRGTETQAQRFPAPAPRPRRILRPERSRGLCRKGRQTALHRLHGARVRQLPRNGSPRMGRPASARHPAQRLRDRGALLRRQESASRERMGDHRCGQGAQEPRQNQLILRAEYLRGQRPALLRVAGARREGVGSAPRLRPRRAGIRRFPPQRRRSLRQAEIGIPSPKKACGRNGRRLFQHSGRRISPRTRRTSSCSSTSRPGRGKPRRYCPARSSAPYAPQPASPRRSTCRRRSPPCG